MTQRAAIGLDDANAATVRRIAELTGIPAALIVRRLYRTHPGCQYAIDLANTDERVSEWSKGRKILMTPEEREQRFRRLAWAVASDQG